MLGCYLTLGFFFFFKVIELVLQRKFYRYVSKINTDEVHGVKAEVTGQSPIQLACSRFPRNPKDSCLENPMDGGAWWAPVHGVAKSWTRLSDFTFTFQFHALEKEMATHSSVLTWRIPGMGEPGGYRLWGCTASDTTEVT